MATFPCDAMYLYMPFDDIIKKADVIFLAKVTDQTSRYGSAEKKMIFTDVSFDVVNLIYKSEKSEPIIANRNSIMLTFAGGSVEGEAIWVSDVPSFETGSTYLIFTLMDGKTYASPIVGGYQGLFNVITDEETGQNYALTYGKRGIIEIKDGDVVTTPPVAKIKGGLIEKALQKSSVKFHDVAPAPAQGMDQTKVSASVSPVAAEMPGKIMTLDELIGAIQAKIKKGGDK